MPNWVKTIVKTDSSTLKDIIKKYSVNNELSFNKIIPNLHNGEIMLLHATSKTNADIMDEMIKKVQEEGYEFRSIDDFVK